MLFWHNTKTNCYCQLQTGTCQGHCQWLDNNNKDICHLPALLQQLTLDIPLKESRVESEALRSPEKVVEQVFR